MKLQNHEKLVGHFFNRHQFFAILLAQVVLWSDDFGLQITLKWTISSVITLGYLYSVLQRDYFAFSISQGNITLRKLFKKKSYEPEALLGVHEVKFSKPIKSVFIFILPDYTFNLSFRIDSKKAFQMSTFLRSLQKG